MNEDDPAMVNSPPAEGAGSHVGSQRLSPQQVEEIYTGYSQDLFAFLIGVLKDRDRAQDVLQETFRRLAQSGGTARSETLRGWLFQVAYREAMLSRRKERQETRHRTSWWKISHTLRGGHPPQDPLVTAEELERLRQALDELPPEQRVVVQRKTQHEETFAEIAAYLGLPLGTVLTRMRIALQKLRKSLHDDSDS